MTPVKQPAVPMPPEVTPSAPAQPPLRPSPWWRRIRSRRSIPPTGPIAEKLRDLLASKSDRIFATKKERAAVEAFYQNRNLAPIWFDKGIETARTKAVIARMKAADADGLDPERLQDPEFRRPRPAPMRRRKPSSSSPRSCSPTRATRRPAASRISASA